MTILYSLTTSAPAPAKKPPPPDHCPKKPILSDDLKKHYQVLRLPKPKYLNNSEGESEWVWWYYVKKNTKQSSFFPPPPHDPDDEEDEVASPTIDLTEEGGGKEGMKLLQDYFFCPPGDNTFSTGIQNVEEMVEEEVVDVDQDQDPIEEHHVYDDVFTGDKPIFLRMDDKQGVENNLKRKATELGIYVPRMKRVEIEKALEKYWINECGGWDVYTKAPIFHQEDQDICRERKISTNVKRKAEFAASQTEEKKLCKNKKLAMTPKVNYILVFLLSPC